MSEFDKRSIIFRIHSTY